MLAIFYVIELMQLSLYSESYIQPRDTSVLRLHGKHCLHHLIKPFPYFQQVLAKHIGRRCNQFSFAINNNLGHCAVLVFDAKLLQRFCGTGIVTNGQVTLLPYTFAASAGAMQA